MLYRNVPKNVPYVFSILHGRHFEGVRWLFLVTFYLSCQQNSLYVYMCVCIYKYLFMIEVIFVQTRLSWPLAKLLVGALGEIASLF